MRFQSLAEILRHYARERGERPAMVSGERSWTYRELRDEAARVAQALRAEGVGDQARVAVLDKNAGEYFAVLFGASMNGAVTLAVNWRLAPREMQYILDHARAQVLLVGEEFLGHLAQMQLETVERVVVFGRAEAPHVAYADWIASHEAIDPEAPTDPDDTCYQLYTSGTTGLPKGVELTHRNFLHAMEIGARHWVIDEDSVALVAMPLFHIAGSGWGIAGFHAGGLNVVLREVDPVGILRAIPAHGITNALFVPAVLQLLLATPGVDETDFSTLRMIVYGASPITEDVLVRSMKAFRCDFVQVYGLTETTGAITALDPADHDPGGPRAHLLRSAGRPWGDVELRIVDPETGRDVEGEGAVGEIWIRAHQNMKGYWRNPEATAEAFPEGRGEDGRGWFRSGDAGYLRDGYLFMHDRVKDMIVSGAENVYPAEVENVLMAHPGVADVAVIGVPSELWGETVKAIVVDAPGAAAPDDALIAWCRERLAHYKCPTSVDRIAALPRNPSGKILKTELREPYWKGRERRIN